MAKKEQVEEQKPDAVEIPDSLKVTADAFENTPGDTFGGTSEILVFGEEEAVGPLTYVGHRLTNLGNGLADADIHEAKDADGATWRLPIATNFRRQAEGANLLPGDTFLIKRLKNEIKKNGVGKGGSMQMYQIKVTRRAPAKSAVAA